MRIRNSAELFSRSISPLPYQVRKALLGLGILSVISGVTIDFQKKDGTDSRDLAVPAHPAPDRTPVPMAMIDGSLQPVPLETCRTIWDLRYALQGHINPKSDLNPRFQKPFSSVLASEGIVFRDFAARAQLTACQHNTPTEQIPVIAASDCEKTSSVLSAVGINTNPGLTDWTADRLLRDMEISFSCPYRDDVQPAGAQSALCVTLARLDLYSKGYPNNRRVNDGAQVTDVYDFSEEPGKAADRFCPSGDTSDTCTTLRNIADNLGRANSRGNLTYGSVRRVLANYPRSNNNCPF